MINLANEFHPYPKEKQLEHNRINKTAKQRGSISPAVRKEVEVRSRDCCERCGKHKSQVWTLENAHIERRWRTEGKITANDIARLCGPSTQSGTCHHWADYTREGREWLKSFQNSLREKDAG